MSKNDDNKLFKLSVNDSLEDASLLSDTSIELRNIIAINGIKNIKSFLEYFDKPNNLGISKLEILIEVRGLVDLIKYQCFNTPLLMEPYLNQPIQYMQFKIYGSPIWMYGIKSDKLVDMNIHTILKRLGFNDEERNLILNMDEKYLDGLRLIDLLNDAYNRVKYNPDKYKCIRNKLLLIMNYYLMSNRKDGESEFMTQFFKDYEELVDVLSRKNALEKEKKSQNRGTKV